MGVENIDKLSYSALDGATTSKTHLRITALSAAGTFLDGYDISIISVALILLYGVPSFGLGTPLAKALIGASTTIGMLFGAIIFGYITDLRGRKTMYVWDMVIFIVMTVLISVSFNFLSLFITRFILGLAIGADYAISSTIIAEFAPQKSRGKLLIANFLSWFAGAAVAVFVGYALLSLGALSWRYMFLLGIIPAIIVLILRRDVPESARWLARNGQVEKAKEVEMKIAGSSDILSSSSANRKTSLLNLFSRKYIRSTLFVAIFWFCTDVSFYGIAIFNPTILTILGFSSHQAILGAGVFDLFAVIGGITAMMLIERLGRKTITLIGFIGETVSLVALGVITHFVPTAALALSIAPVIFGMFLLFEITQAIGPGSTDFVYPLELFPTTERATAQGFGTSVSRLGAILGITTFPFIVASFGISSSLFFFGLFAVIGLLATIFLGVETKGRTLEQSSEDELFSMSKSARKESPLMPQLEED